MNTKAKQRLSRETWLEEALHVIADDPTHLRIDELAARLGVSKGSFYWHFENRNDFVHALAEYWRDVDTVAVVEFIESDPGTAAERLRKLMGFIAEHRPARYDLPIRALARIEPDILPIVREADEIRLQCLRRLFSELGFSGVDLEVRTRAFVVWNSFEDAMAAGLTPKELNAQLDTRFEFLTRK